MTACLLHEIIEAHTGSHHDRDLVESNIHILDEFYVGVQYRAGEIPGKKQIAAFSNVKQRLGQLVKVKALKLFDVLILHKTLAGHLHPESVLRTQVIFQFDSHCSYVEARKSSSICESSILEGESIITSRP